MKKKLKKTRQDKTIMPSFQLSFNSSSYSVPSLPSLSRGTVNLPTPHSTHAHSWLLYKLCDENPFDLLASSFSRLMCQTWSPSDDLYPPPTERELLCWGWGSTMSHTVVDLLLPKTVVGGAKSHNTISSVFHITNIDLVWLWCGGPPQ